MVTCKKQIYQCHNATKNCALLKIYKSWQASECHKHFNWIFLTFGSLQKSNSAMPQRHKLLKRIFLSFRVLAKNQICQCLNATRNRALLKVCKSGQASESSMPQAFESDFPNFRVLVKIKFGAAKMPQAFETDFPIFLVTCKKQICQCYNATKNCALL